MLLLKSRDFGAIAIVNAIMFMTANGSRSVLVPLLATQSFNLSTTVLGEFQTMSRDEVLVNTLMMRL
jgi:hypothetical protein